VQTLFEVMCDSAALIDGSERDFRRLWDQFAALVHAGELDFPRAEIEAFTEKLSGDTAPVIHHSEKYRRENAPAYRVVAAEVFHESFANI
jgi:hypothetical protein